MSNNIVNKAGSILYKSESFALQGAIFEVYRELGCGFLESVYQECLCNEFKSRNIPFISQPQINIQYKGVFLESVFRPDFVCYDLIIVELKATKDIGDENRAQLFNYLKISKMRLGLLVNFGHYPRATIERIVL